MNYNLGSELFRKNIYQETFVSLLLYAKPVNHTFVFCFSILFFINVNLYET